MVHKNSKSLLEENKILSTEMYMVRRSARNIKDEKNKE